MTDQPELRDDLRAVIRQHDPQPSELRSIAADLETLADRWEDAEEVL